MGFQGSTLFQKKWLNCDGQDEMPIQEIHILKHLSKYWVNENNFRWYDLPEAKDAIGEWKL